ncbi:MAG: hypothetical protein PHF51_03075, partial [Candidatus ainarchaeum sp.]|nr:hypothetical protein [Candidatus ainarchaeum sp.]
RSSDLDYTGADIENVCREAGMNAIRDKSDKVTMEHFDAAIRATSPSISGNRTEAIKKFVQQPQGAMYR